MGRFAAMLVVLGVLISTVAVRAQEATPVVGADVAPLTFTAVRYLLPFTGDGLNPALTVREEATGSCDLGSSAAAGRPDAWSCQSDAGAVLDPCIQSPFSTADDPGGLACFSSPFDRAIVQLTVTSPLPTPAATDAATPGTMTPALPWAIELADGSQCTIARGATVLFAGMRVNYFCPGGSILGEPDRGQPVWTVQYLPDGALVTEQVPVRAVWP